MRALNALLREWESDGERVNGTSQTTNGSHSVLRLPAASPFTLVRPHGADPRVSVKEVRAKMQQAAEALVGPIEAPPVPQSGKPPPTKKAKKK